MDDNAAMDLIADQQDALDTLKKMYDAKVAEVEALKAAAAQPDELSTALAARVEWFDTFRSLVWPAAAQAPQPEQTGDTQSRG